MLVVLFWCLPSNLWAGALPLSKQLEDNNAAQRTKLSFAQQVTRTAEKPDLWREGCIPSLLGIAASPPTSCVPASLQLRPVPAEGLK